MRFFFQLRNLRWTECNHSCFHALLEFEDFSRRSHNVRPGGQVLVLKQAQDTSHVSCGFCLPGEQSSLMGSWRHFPHTCGWFILHSALVTYAFCPLSFQLTHLFLECGFQNAEQKWLLSLSNEEASGDTLYDQRCIARPKTHQVDIKKYKHLTLCPITVLLRKHHPDSNFR